ncbi:hypothetical protein A3A95_03555 [Candidatus Nomurabacteria bacterium RIFCSPLOWO2_01_FULL_39_18]|uniref:DoxX family protein n=1 Tax=Candidatus Nomurabacteria bacterium RIFCSPHIGHO2_01_FULL_40_24b TaxID=1801739 RepID=A0A1F6V6H2_9BACT|nr:MAG: hypothetical protein A2647_04965 [Candidatus Nomurabacteria bacterium RIFCSPHIGHO2_01_FULL_40_24b]OGI89185.1 MAG: hypothetical protein A3A95_03555 [Candidatus Nomurabacteria bacterium RIFCSPLOWO2_01_FULL_39_18]
MNRTSFHVLRVGLAITFLWIGILILKNPGAWGGFIAPWAMKLMPAPVEQMMVATAWLDIIIGALLLFDVLVWLGAILAAGHLVMVLVVSGINDVTVRDIAILAGSLALFAESIPAFIRDKFVPPRIKI